MTEIIPVSATTCSQGHLHHDISMGYVEVLDLTSGRPAAPGALATVVVTPYFPYRECMPVLRYDTRDIVRALPSPTLACESAGLPATSQIVGKAEGLMPLGPTRVVTPRELVEAVEALPTRPWPARFQADVIDSRLRLTLPRSALDGLSEQYVREHFLALGLDVILNAVADDQSTGLRRLRSDLHETTFTNASPGVRHV